MVLTEVEELHRFFEQWLGGETEDFARADRVLAPTFTIIGPGGNLRTREELVRGLLEVQGKRPVKIEVRNLVERPLGDGFVLATYEEWQDGKGRISTALLRAREDAPNGLEWLHVHETWLAT